jgi:hypothetical protein
MAHLNVPQGICSLGGLLTDHHAYRRSTSDLCTQIASASRCRSLVASLTSRPSASRRRQVYRSTCFSSNHSDLIFSSSSCSLYITGIIVPRWTQRGSRRRCMRASSSSRACLTKSSTMGSCTVRKSLLPDCNRLCSCAVVDELFDRNVIVTGVVPAWMGVRLPWFSDECPLAHPVFVQQTISGLDAIKRFVVDLRCGFPNMVFAIEDIAYENSNVHCRWRGKVRGVCDTR